MKVFLSLPVLIMVATGTFVACNSSEDGVTNCGNDADCSSGFVCFNGSCMESGGDSDAGPAVNDGGNQPGCAGDGDCAADEECQNS